MENDCVFQFFELKNTQIINYQLSIVNLIAFEVLR